MQALSQLSYSPTEVGREGTGRLPRLSTFEEIRQRGGSSIAAVLAATPRTSCADVAVTRQSRQHLPIAGFSDDGRAKFCP